VNAIDYAIERQVTNNPIVREVDAASHRERWRAAVLLVVLVAAALFYSWQRARFLGLGYESEQVRKALAVEKSRTEQLRLELETLRAPRQVEARAMRELRLVRPGPDQYHVIERVRPAAPPSAAVVASR
jgi:cell division protein FtsB